VDQLLYQSGMFRNEDLDKLAGGQHGLIMDSNDLERERGITILAKNCAVHYTTPDGETYKINLIDTPGHADFGGEVERVLKMADGVLLVVDAFEGPMPQTRFVLGKALEHKLKPVVVVNKIDRPDARPDDVVNEVFDLLVELDADDESLDFPIIYSSAKQGWASRDAEKRGENMKVLFDTIVSQVPAPSPDESDVNAPPQMLVTSLDYSDYVGRIAIGRVFAGTLRPGMPVTVIDRAGKHSQQRILKTLQFDGLGRREVDSVEAGDICAVVGLDPIDIGNTIACHESPVALPTIKIDEPTLHMTFRINDSPFAGREGTYVTSRQISDRLQKELRSNVALRVETGETPEQFRVSGRGLMHIGVVIENMRREGFELSVGKPRVINKEVDGQTHEPVELLVVDCPTDCQSSVMALVGDRRAELLKMDAKAGTSGFVHLEFTIPARGLMGLRSRMLTATQGRAIMHHVLLRYEPLRGDIAGAERSQGVLIASEPGQVTAYALDALYDRGFFFVSPGEQVYEGQVVGEHNRENDLMVNVVKGKKLSNVRASGKDDAAQVRPARKMSLEASLEYIDEDELVEITPESIRMRKKMLKEADRRRDTRRAKSLADA
ncbi:MAG: translational GTPase TypA, partial [Phycisphaeraceae bacterium]